MDNFINVRGAETRIFQHDEIPTRHVGDEIRVYNSSYGASVQIRTIGTTNRSGTGVKRYAYSHADLNLQQIDKLIELLQEARHRY